MSALRMADMGIDPCFPHSSTTSDSSNLADNNNNNNNINNGNNNNNNNDNNSNNNNNNSNRIQRREFLQSHCSASRLQHVCLSGPGATVCKSRATH